MITEPKVILVDSSDNPVGEMGKMEAHLRGELHRAVSVFVFNSNNQLLLQRRALSKYHSPGLWTNTACTHPYPGECNEKAAIRRLKEEMGIEVTSATKIFDFIYRETLNDGLIEHEFDHVFIAFSDEKPTPAPDEVSDFCYVDLDEIIQSVEENPDKYTVWFKKIVHRVVEEIKNRIFAGTKK